MELLIPSLAFLLAAVAIAFFVLPKFAPATLVVGSAVVLALAAYEHWKKFGVAEYERATWLKNARHYGGWIMVVVILLGAYGFYAMNNTGGGGAIATPSLPPVSTPQLGGDFGDVAKTATSRIRELMRHGRIST
jgi:hypothetical protein